MELERESSPPTDPDRWPAIDSAYDFVLPSYQWAVSRYEAADTRLTQTVTLIAGVIFGLPALAKTFVPEGESAGSPLLYVGLALLGLAAAIGILARHQGRLIVVDPGVHFRKSLHLSDWEFRKNAIHDAGVHLEKNWRAIEHKGSAAEAVLGLALIGLVFGVIALVR